MFEKDFDHSLYSDITSVGWFLVVNPATSAKIAALAEEQRYDMIT